jgi:hypothetical protein
MNRRLALAAVLCAAAAFRAAPAAAQTDTASAAPAAPAATAGAETELVVRPARRDMNRISAVEVQNAQNLSDAYELIHTLRRAWLRAPRGSTSTLAPIDVAVFMNGVRLGTRDALKTIPITAVKTARFYTAVDARRRFGGDTSAGAIEIESN